VPLTVPQFPFGATHLTVALSAKVWFCVLLQGEEDVQTPGSGLVRFTIKFLAMVSECVRPIAFVKKRIIDIILPATSVRPIAFDTNFTLVNNDEDASLKNIVSPTCLKRPNNVSELSGKARDSPVCLKRPKFLAVPSGTFISEAVVFMKPANPKMGLANVSEPVKLRPNVADLEETSDKSSGSVRLILNVVTTVAVENE
jgi:hypothetical protein